MRVISKKPPAAITRVCGKASAVAPAVLVSAEAITWGK